MSNRNIIRAWKDPGYRNSLTEVQRAALPPNPAGAIEIPERELGRVAGGLLPRTYNPIACTEMCSLNHTGSLCPTELVCITNECTIRI
jgi:mersacidin/lichenicidin family type 2 lantibiotic